jgi:acyl carrier protein
VGTGVTAESSASGALRVDGAVRRAWLLGTLAGLAPDFDGAIGDETPLADGGLGLDSLAIIDLVGAIEEQMGVTIDEDEITREHFETAGRLLRLLEAHLG